jgi:hypothetical protein
MTLMALCAAHLHCLIEADGATPPLCQNCNNRQTAHTLIVLCNNCSASLRQCAMCRNYGLTSKQRILGK